MSKTLSSGGQSMRAVDEKNIYLINVGERAPVMTRM